MYTFSQSYVWSASVYVCVCMCLTFPVRESRAAAMTPHHPLLCCHGANLLGPSVSPAQSAHLCQDPTSSWKSPLCGMANKQGLLVELLGLSMSVLEGLSMSEGLAGRVDGSWQ